MVKTAERLLVVEDEAINREILQEYLVDAGYEVTLAEDGEAGWDAINRPGSHFDAILLDRMMPRLDGMGLLARIKAEPRFRFVPVIFQTAVANPADVAEGLRAGAYYYLTKPFSQDVLLAIVRAAVADVAQVRDLSEQMALTQADLNLVTGIEFRFRSLGDARRLAEILARFFPEPGQAVIGIAELLINGVEHGNLGISYAEKSSLLQQNRWEAEIERRLALEEYTEKTVKVRLDLTHHFLTLTVCDDGAGFDWRGYLDISPERAYDPNGRGIAMARMLSFDSLEYRGRGNEVVARKRVNSAT